jgi:tetratricopeptide (TPR) repeat protein
MHSRAKQVLGRVRVAVLAAVALAVVGAPPAAAQGQATPVPATDRIDLVKLSTTQVGPSGPHATMRFNAQLKYGLQSASEGFVLLFLFENNADSSTEHSSDGIPVKKGAGEINAAIDYTPKDGVRTLTLVAGLFRAQNRLLTWVSTNPIPLAPWPGHADFEKAMSERIANDFAAAEQDLSAAIQAGPDTGNYYYWRGDTRIRLQRFDDAIADFTRSIELMPKDRASRVGRGVAELWSGDPNAAIGDLSTAIDASTTPDHITAWAHRARGVAEASLDQPERAIADYRAYLTIVPDAADRALVEGWIADLS